MTADQNALRLLLLTFAGEDPVLSTYPAASFSPSKQAFVGS